MGGRSQSIRALSSSLAKDRIVTPLCGRLWRRRCQRLQAARGAGWEMVASANRESPRPRTQIGCPFYGRRFPGSRETSQIETGGFYYSWSIVARWKENGPPGLNVQRWRSSVQRLLALSLVFSWSAWEDGGYINFGQKRRNNFRDGSPSCPTFSLFDGIPTLWSVAAIRHTAHRPESARLFAKE